LRKPKNPIPGTDVAGVVESVGRGVARFKPGDAVFGTTVFMRLWNGGTYAEYVAAPEHMLVHKPANVTFEQAACVPTSGVITLCNLRPHRIQPGARVLVNGAGGNVGALAVQLAKARRAHVTGIDSSARLDFLRSLGTDRVIDYTNEDFTEGSEQFDLIFDVATTLSPEKCEPLLTATGFYWMIGHDHFGKASGRILGSIPRMLKFMMRSRRKRPHDASFKLPPLPELLSALRDHLERGEITPLIAKVFPLTAVPAAMRYMQETKSPGRVVIQTTFP
jgi:NADPH:quinone reductase-like Zn-dependent oxidoreductase